MKFLFATVAFLAAAFAAHDVAQLTAVNFDEEVFQNGKNAFVKFYAPWCGHCKKIAPVWEELATKYADSDSVLIGEVDCDDEANKQLCTRQGAHGFPTIMTYMGYSAAKTGVKYDGKRDLEAMSEHVEKNLGTSCSNSHKEKCSSSELAALEATNLLSDAELTKKIETAEKTITDAIAAFEKKTAELQAEYKASLKHKDSILARTPKDFAMWQTVNMWRKQQAKKKAHSEL